MRVAAVVLLVAACRSDSGGGGSRTVDVVAMAGGQTEPGAQVIAHTTSGAVIDRTQADAVGRASIGVDDDSLISIVFPGAITTVTPVVSVVTTQAPADGVMLTVHGPDRTGPVPLIVGALELDGSNLSGANYFEVDVGCATVRITKLPEFIDIGACSLGSDTSLDVLARGYHDVGGDPPAPVLDGYAAGRAQMVDGRAVLNLPAWKTSGTPIPITLDGVTPYVSWRLYADGVPFVDEPIYDAAYAYAGLAVDQTIVAGTIANTGFARIVERYIAGVPTSIAFAAADFLPAFELATEITNNAPLAFSWDPAPAGVDAIHLHTGWGGSTVNVVPGSYRVVWDAVLPPEATHVSLPALDDELGTTLGGAGALVPTDVLLRHLDSSALPDFAALQAAGIHAEETTRASPIVAPPAGGEVRIAHVIGVR